MRVKITFDGAGDDARGRNFQVKILNLSKFGITIEKIGFYYIGGCRQRKPLSSLYYRSLENPQRLEPRGTHGLTMTFLISVVSRLPVLKQFAGYLPAGLFVEKEFTKKHS